MIRTNLKTQLFYTCVYLLLNNATAVYYQPYNFDPVLGADWNSIHQAQYNTQTLNEDSNSNSNSETQQQPIITDNIVQQQQQQQQQQQLQQQYKVSHADLKAGWNSIQDQDSYKQGTQQQQDEQKQDIKQQYDYDQDDYYGSYSEQTLVQGNASSLQDTESLNVQDSIFKQSSPDPPQPRPPEEKKERQHQEINFPQFETKRDELLFWAAKGNNEHIIKTYLAEVAVCVLVKDEHLDILEWIQYHRFIGVGKFYVYDNNSLPPMINMLRPLLNRGIIEYQYLNGTFWADDYLIQKKKLEFTRKHDSQTTTEMLNSVQVWAMTNCVTSYGGRHKWIAFIDVDEFLVFPDKHPIQNPPNLPEFLTQYEHAGGLVVYRKNFGSSGHIQRPNSGVLASYTKCMLHMYDEERQYYPKVILNTQYFKQGGECRIHECSTIKKMVNTKKDWVETKWFWGHDTRTWHYLLIHHYVTKSVQDFRLKQQRGMPHSRAFKKKSESFRRDSFFLQIDNKTVGDCTYAVEYSDVCCKTGIKQSQVIFQRFMKFRGENLNYSQFTPISQPIQEIGHTHQKDAPDLRGENIGQNTDSQQQQYQQNLQTENIFWEPAPVKLPNLPPQEFQRFQNSNDNSEIGFYKQHSRDPFQ